MKPSQLFNNEQANLLSGCQIYCQAANERWGSCCQTIQFACMPSCKGVINMAPDLLLAKARKLIIGLQAFWVTAMYRVSISPRSHLYYMVLSDKSMEKKNQIKAWKRKKEKKLVRS